MLVATRTLRLAGRVRPRGALSAWPVPGSPSPSGSPSGSPPGGARGLLSPAAHLRDSLVESVIRSDSAWVDAPTAVVEDPLHPNGFDFSVDLEAKPACSPLGVAGFADGVKRNGAAPDPFDLVAGEIDSLSDGIRKLLGSDHPVLELCARYFFDEGRDGGKKVRPTMVLLVSVAANQHAAAAASAEANEGKAGVPTAAAAAAGPGDTFALGPAHPAASALSAASASGASSAAGSVGAASVKDAALEGLSRAGTLAAQRRLAEITEMIHTASLFHDDVIDKADARRGSPSANRAHGDKLAILAGDFLLARASVALARLRNVEVVELLSTVIEHLVKGEVMQMRGGHLKDCSALEYYFHKNYYKTGSLMSNSCRAAAALGAHPAQVQDACFAYGKHIGLAFQLVDDVLDFEGSLQSLGKPALADLKAGLATAPVLLAAEEFPRLQTLIDRKFATPGDVDEALQLVKMSRGLQRTKDLAVAQADLAIEAVSQLAPSRARDALQHLAYKIVTRKN